MDKIGKLFLLLVLFNCDLSAQKVTETADGFFVIDLTALEPLGAVLSFADASTRLAEMKKQTPSDETLLGGGLNVSGENGTWNAKMSKKFQVMKNDLVIEPGEFEQLGEFKWSSAWKSCLSYVGEGGGAGTWRLPTQRELLMIWILHPQLKSYTGFAPLDGGTYGLPYWSSTDVADGVMWVLTTTSVSMNVQIKTNPGGAFVRCVRDLE